jgi:hypothetical protein
MQDETVEEQAQGMLVTREICRVLYETDPEFFRRSVEQNPELFLRLFEDEPIGHDLLSYVRERLRPNGGELMAGPKNYGSLDTLAFPPGATAGPALHALRHASCEARQAELEAGHAREIADQARWRVAVREAERTLTTTRGLQS